MRRKGANIYSSALAPAWLGEHERRVSDLVRRVARQRAHDDQDDQRCGRDDSENEDDA
jgi:hypothetical protein